MTPEERERAERIARTLRPTDPGSWELSTVYVLDELAAFAREERARAYEQMRTVLMESEEFDYYLDWISDQITKLREEGR